jgi:hypothetical protein
MLAVLAIIFIFVARFNHFLKDEMDMTIKAKPPQFNYHLSLTDRLLSRAASTRCCNFFTCSAGTNSNGRFVADWPLRWGNCCDLRIADRRSSSSVCPLRFSKSSERSRLDLPMYCS